MQGKSIPAEHVVHTCPDWLIPVVVLALFAVVALMGFAAYRAAGDVR
jgi:hypothetical protein